MSVTQIPTRATSASKSCLLCTFARTLASIRPPSISAKALGSSLAYSTRAWSCSMWFLIFVGPFDRDPSRALGHLLRSLRVAHDRRQVALELELALEHALRHVQLFHDDLFPS